MKSNKLLIALALCAAMQSNISFCMENPLGEPQAPQSKSYWQQYAPQFMQNTRSAMAKKYEDTIGKWSTRNKLILLGAILTTLGVGAYYRNEIMQMISSGISARKVEGNISSGVPAQTQELTGGSNIPEINNINAENVESIGDITLYPNKKDTLKEELKAAEGKFTEAWLKQHKAVTDSHLASISGVPREIQVHFVDRATKEDKILDAIQEERDNIYEKAILTGVPKEEADAILQVGRNKFDNFNWRQYTKDKKAEMGALKHKKN